MKENNSNIPNLVWDEFFWEGKITLPSWAGSQSRGGAYGSVDSQSPAEGIYNLILEPGDGEQPSAYQETAYNYLLQNESHIYSIVINALLNKYPEWYSIFHEYVAESGNEMPKDMNSVLIREHTGIANVHILPVEKESHGYIGFELGCSWDDEHGIGVMLHKDRIIEIGGADAAFLTWIAERDKNIENIIVPLSEDPTSTISHKK